MDPVSYTGYVLVTTSLISIVFTRSTLDMINLDPAYLFISNSIGFYLFNFIFFAVFKDFPPCSLLIDSTPIILLCDAFSLVVAKKGKIFLNCCLH